nr:HNH endonuclease [Aneurinibacillus migulanus]
MLSRNSEQDRYYDKYKRNKEAKRFYDSAAWRKCRDYVLKRDNYLCQPCLKQSMKLKPADTVHHIKHFDEAPELALDPDNLECVCNACHNRLHPEKGQGKAKEKSKQRKVRVIQVEANREVT